MDEYLDIMKIRVAFAAENAALADSLSAKGKKIYLDNSSGGCHSEDGSGSDSGPKLIGVSAKHGHDAIAILLKNPIQKMRDGSMDPVELPDDDMNALIAYLNSLK